MSTREPVGFDMVEVKLGSVTARLQTQMSILRGAERRLAEMILVSPGDMKGLSIADLAMRARVSASTVNRLSRQLGYSGYRELKLALVEEMAPVQRDPKFHSEVRTDDPTADLVAKVFGQNAHALRVARDALNLSAFDEVVRILSEARSVELVGVGSSLPVAMDLYYRLVRTGVPARCQVDAHMQAVSAALLGPGDAVFAVSYSGATRDTLDAVRVAKQAGATVVCLTCFNSTPLAACCDVSLVVPTKRVRWLHETIAARLIQYAVADALCVALARGRDQELNRRAAAIDTAVALKR